MDDQQHIPEWWRQKYLRDEPGPEPCTPPETNGISRDYPSVPEFQRAVSRRDAAEETEAQARWTTLQQYLASRYPGLSGAPDIAPPRQPWLFPFLRKAAAKAVSWLKPACLTVLWLCQLATIFLIEVQHLTVAPCPIENAVDFPDWLPCQYVVATFVTGLFAPLFWVMVHGKRDQK